jgi:hypothetical protein
MTTSAGVWIDHRRAVIVVVSEGRESASEIRSHVESQPGRIDGVRSTAPHEAQLMKADDSHEREFTGHLKRYYAEVIAALPAVDALLIFGPGEAKGELRKRVEHSGFKGCVVETETADKMTHGQIVAKVHEYHREQAAPALPMGHAIAGTA